MKKRSKNIATMAVAATLVFSMVSPVLAAAEPTPKEEVVYGVLNADGSVRSASVVNIFTLSKEGTIFDFGNYTETRNMTTTAPIEVEGDTIRIEAASGKLFYEGVLEEPQFPWNIAIRYWMDGTEYKPEELAGKSGTVTMKISVTENTKGADSFFNEFALQTTVTLSRSIFTNIQTTGATAANVGSNQQFTYTVLPGTEKEISLTATVNDFEMEPISIAGVRLSLGIEIDNQELLQNVADLSAGIARLDDGVVEFAGGIDTLQSGADSIADGIAKMQKGVTQLNSKSSALQNSSSAMQDALQKLQESMQKLTVSSTDLTALVDASAQIKQGIVNLETSSGQLKTAATASAFGAAMQQNGLDVDAILAGNAGAIAALPQQMASLQALKDSLPDADQQAQVQQLIDSLASLTPLLQGNSGTVQGAKTYIDGLGGAATSMHDGSVNLQTQYAAFDTKINELSAKLGGMAAGMSQLQASVQKIVDNYQLLHDGTVSYTNGVAELVTGFNQLSSGASSLQDGVTQLKTGADEITDGTGELRENTQGMDDEINTKIEDQLEKMNGDGSPVVSFVSDKNTDVKSVQFVFRTDAVRKVAEDPVVIEAQEQESGFADLLRGLFQ